MLILITCSSSKQSRSDTEKKKWINENNKKLYDECDHWVKTMLVGFILHVTYFCVIKFYDTVTTIIYIKYIIARDMTIILLTVGLINGQAYEY